MSDTLGCSKKILHKSIYKIYVGKNNKINTDLTLQVEIRKIFYIKELQELINR